MPANVVAMSVQTGSGGFAVAHRVAEGLGFRYYDWEITSEAASRAGVSPTEVIAAERVPGFLERMMRRLGAVSTVSLETSAVFSDPSPDIYSTALQGLTSDDYRQFIEKVVLELGEHGSAVIVGHAAQHTLTGHSGVLRVLVHGSASIRADRLAVEQNMDLEAAKGMVRQSDKDRSELLRRVYKFDWLGAASYDLSINTDHLSLEYATEAILAAAKNWP